MKELKERYERTLQAVSLLLVNSTEMQKLCDSLSPHEI